MKTIFLILISLSSLFAGDCQFEKKIYYWQFEKKIDSCTGDTTYNKSFGIGNVFSVFYNGKSKKFKFREGVNVTSNEVDSIPVKIKFEQKDTTIWMLCSLRGSRLEYTPVNDKYNLFIDNLFSEYINVTFIFHNEDVLIVNTNRYNQQRIK